MIKIYKVGGCVRDEILNKKNKDVDYCVEAESFEDMRTGIISLNYTILYEKLDYFTIRAKDNKTKEITDLCKFY